MEASRRSFFSSFRIPVRRRHASNDFREAATRAVLRSALARQRRLLSLKLLIFFSFFFLFFGRFFGVRAATLQFVARCALAGCGARTSFS